MCGIMRRARGSMRVANVLCYETGASSRGRCLGVMCSSIALATGSASGAHAGSPS
jgi:hypothetical protein